MNSMLKSVVSVLAFVMLCAPPMVSGAYAQGAHEQSHAAGTAAAEAPNPLVFDPDLAIFTAIVFLLVLLVLGKFAWPQIVAALDARERTIEDSIAAAKATNEEAKRLLAEHEARLAAAAGEVRGLLEEARRDAEATRARILSEAQKERQQELQRAVREIELAKDGAIQDLAVASANVAIELARKVVREKITAEEQSSLVRNAMENLAAVAPSQN